MKREPLPETAEKRLLYMITQVDYIMKELPSMNIHQLIILNYDLTTMIARLEMLEAEIEAEKSGML